MKAPDFTLRDQDGITHTLTAYRGNWVVVYFYPKDDTPGCTKEACSFRDNLKEFGNAGVVVLGISKDSMASHKKFQEKYHLPFALLSDTSTQTLQDYGAWGMKKFMGREFTGTLRKTFIIDPDGDIRKVYDKVSVLSHGEEVFDAVMKLRQG